MNKKWIKSNMVWLILGAISIGLLTFQFLHYLPHLHEMARVDDKSGRESFPTLFFNAPHWEFELFVSGIEMLLVDLLIGALLWPKLKSWRRHHAEDDLHHEVDDQVIRELTETVNQLSKKVTELERHRII